MMLNLDPEPACYVLRYRNPELEPLLEEGEAVYIHLSFWCPMHHVYPERFEVVSLRYASRFTHEAAKERQCMGALSASSRPLDFFEDDAYSLRDIDAISDYLFVEHVPEFDPRQPRLL